MTIKQIDQMLEEGYSLKQIALVYSEIANLKIKKIRSSVERNRIFFEEISYVYGLVKVLARKKRMFVSKPKKTICMVLTSNYRFYGSINTSLLDFYIKSTERLETDHIIVGKAAIEYFRSQPVIQRYRQILLKDDMPTPIELKALVNIIKDYNQVLVYHSKLKSLLVQEPAVTDLTASARLEVNDTQVDFKFIFEPILPKVLAFFDSSIINLLLEQTFLESELSRSASRFISMDHAQLEANRYIKQYLKERSFAKISLANNQILENYSAVMAAKGINGQ